MDNFWFTPKHQKEGAEVKFLLKPLDTKGLYRVQISMKGDGVPSADAAFDIFESQLFGWQGITENGAPLVYSRAARQKILAGDASLDWMLWIAESIGNLYSKALLGDSEKKD